MAYRAPAPEPEPDWHCRTCGDRFGECDHAGSWPKCPNLTLATPRRSFWANVLVLLMRVF